MSTPFFPAWRSFLAPLGRTVQSVKRSSLSDLEAFFQSVFPPDLLNQAPSGFHSRNRALPLRTTFWLGLFQALKPGTSIRETLRHHSSVLILASNRPAPSPSAYCKAKRNLPTQVLHNALAISAKAAWQRTSRATSGSIAGRPVKVVDATSAQLPDTSANQKLFPQPCGQAKGCGFPVMKIMALFCLASGAVLNVSAASLRWHDTRLFRTLWAWLKPGDICLGDRAFGDYLTLASLPLQQVDVISRLHQGRSPDFRCRTKRLGTDDALFTWLLPLARPKSVGQRQWKKLPGRITVRLIKAKAELRGFRTRSVTIATTLLDPEKYPASEIADLYLRRWRIELCFRDLKTTMGMERLRGQTPEMAMNEMLLHLIAHNLIRVLMAESSREYDVSLERISFKGSVDSVRQFSVAMSRARTAKKRRTLRQALYESLAHDCVPERPGRREPRAVKRRPKPFARLNRPRRKYRERLHRNRWITKKHP